MLFISPRNQIFQNQGMLIRSECRALFYSEEMAAFAEALRDTRLQELVTKTVASLDKLLQTPEDIEIYLYERTFEEARDEPCLVLHSSGSTGERKYLLCILKLISC